ncbi:MAG: GNAT family N-acetyltransferase [Acidimicrobiales bacterium]
MEGSQGGVTIRTEQPDDRAAVAEVVEAAFGDRAVARLVEAIRATSNFVPDLTLVASVHDRVVGHVMISMVALDDDGTRTEVASLSPLAVAPPFQGRGIGSALVREVTERADRRGEPLVVLEVPHGIHITLPSWAPPEAAQIIRLRRYDPALRGGVVYPPAFEKVTED